MQETRVDYEGSGVQPKRSRSQAQSKHHKELITNLRVGQAELVRMVERVGGVPQQIVTIDFESFFGVQPSEVALVCVSLGGDGTVQVVDQLQAFIGPRFSLDTISADDRSSLEYVFRKVTSIPYSPPHRAARYDYGTLLDEMLAFVKRHDRVGVIFGKAIEMERRALGWLKEVSGRSAELPLLGECEHLIELVLEQRLAQNTFNVFIRELPFRLTDCCPHHAARNTGRSQASLFHCALQDARTFGEIVVNAKAHVERLAQLDAIEVEKARVLAEQQRLKREEEQLLTTPLPWVFRCRGAHGLFVGRAPKTAAEAAAVEKLGVTCCVTPDAGSDALLDSDLGLVRLKLGVAVPVIEEGRVLLGSVLMRDKEVVLLCAAEVRHVRDVYHAFRLVVSRRTKRQVEVEWRMLCAALPMSGPDVDFCDAKLFSAYTNELTICPDYNVVPRRSCSEGVKCSLRHVCSFCKSDQHPLSKCKQRSKPNPKILDD